MKFNKVLFASSMLSAAICFSGMANAAGLSDSVTINFTGVFQNTTCNINLNNTNVTNNGSVDLYLGIHTTDEITVNSDSTEAVPFSVDFTDCGAISEASIVFSGTQTVSTLFDVDGNNKDNVGVGINTTSGAGDYIAIGDKTSVEITNGSGSTNFYARYVKIGDTSLVEGEANSVATMDITYS